MEIDRQIEKEEESSQDNIFPESKANLFTKFGQSTELFDSEQDDLNENINLFWN